MEKTVDYYMSLPYTRELVPNPVVGWGIRIKELPGCMSQGKTPEEAVSMIEDAMRGWLESEIEAGAPIPEPKIEEEFSGKFVIRVPKQLHRLLVENAENNNVSLNQFINVILSQGIEQRNQSKVIEELQAEIQNIKELLLQLEPKETSPIQQFEQLVRAKHEKTVEERYRSRVVRESSFMEPRSNLDIASLLGE